MKTHLNLYNGNTINIFMNSQNKNDITKKYFKQNKLAKQSKYSKPYKAIYSKTKTKKIIFDFPLSTLHFHHTFISLQ